MRADILIDISRLLGRASQGRLPTGVDRVCLAYVQHWGGRAQAVVQKGTWRRILPYKASQELFSLLLAPLPGFARQVNWAIARACVPPWPSQDAAGKPGFYLGHSGIEMPGFAAWVHATRQKPVYFVHDLIPISHAEYCREGERSAHIERMTAMLRTGAGLIGNSQFTLDALKIFADSRGLPMPPAVVAPLAPAPLNGSRGVESPLNRPYFVVLGTIEPRKNHLLLLKVWRELVQRLGGACPHLVVIGQRGWECENVVDMLERCETVRPFVHEIAACPDAELACYLRHARALLFPSFVEGYGMPLVEALLLGTPVVASDLPVFREIAGDIPDFLSPLDGLGWMQVVLDYAATSGTRRQAQLQRLQGFRVPTWKDHFTQAERLLESVA
ncbi:glycosyltransferase family 4 protein [Polaromonas sp. JS666]|uniref:glycosyltransferase family 4 protein n=1 Tax=Polaromonas sp. (strain JS666 / ATCC BAA-500) TaxID=296591 RepID=UPI0000538044|nr:glycosyltransferase family 1 protein [Polaromonas sp. JS666]ABE46798.1 glycosyl transferase, group 1 [Polaromonas sp. JS666]